jgi:hypothetical protein
MMIKLIYIFSIIAAMRVEGFGQNLAKHMSYIIGVLHRMTMS